MVAFNLHMCLGCMIVTASAPRMRAAASLTTTCSQCCCPGWACLSLAQKSNIRLGSVCMSVYGYLYEHPHPVCLAALSCMGTHTKQRVPLGFGLPRDGVLLPQDRQQQVAGRHVCAGMCMLFFVSAAVPFVGWHVRALVRGHGATYIGVTVPEMLQKPGATWPDTHAPLLHQLNAGNNSLKVDSQKSGVPRCIQQASSSTAK